MTAKRCPIQLNARIGYNMGIKHKEMLPMQESKVNTLTGEMIREYAGSLRAQATGGSQLS